MGWVGLRTQGSGRVMSSVSQKKWQPADTFRIRRHQFLERQTHPKMLRKASAGDTKRLIRAGHLRQVTRHVGKKRGPRTIDWEVGERHRSGDARSRVAGNAGGEPAVGHLLRRQRRSAPICSPTLAPPPNGTTGLWDGNMPAAARAFSGMRIQVLSAIVKTSWRPGRTFERRSFVATSSS